MNNKMIKEEKEMEIDLLSLFFFLLDKWKILLLGVVIGAVAAAGITFLQTPMYQSTSTLYVLSKSTSITSVADLQLGSELTSDFTEIATSKPVIDTAIETLKNDENIKLTREQVQDMMSVSNKTDTDWNCNGEIVDDGINGILYPNEEIKTLKDAIICIIKNNCEMIAMKKQCIKTAKKYQPDMYVKRIVERIEK